MTFCIKRIVTAEWSGMQTLEEFLTSHGDVKGISCLGQALWAPPQTSSGQKCYRKHCEMWILAYQIRTCIFKSFRVGPVFPSYMVSSLIQYMFHGVLPPCEAIKGVKMNKVGKMPALGPTDGQGRYPAARQ